MVWVQSWHVFLQSYVLVIFCHHEIFVFLGAESKVGADFEPVFGTQPPDENEIDVGHKGQSKCANRGQHEVTRLRCSFF